MEQGYQDFNESIMVFLPKVPVDTTEFGLEVNEPDGTRPLNITNADNRLMANSVRMSIEKKFDGVISNMQRGFVGGRFLIATIIDVEEAMIRTASTKRFGAAIFYDFAAAFPSVSQDFLIEYFERCGVLPGTIVNFIARLYCGNRCHIAFGGVLYEGFDYIMEIRQGCPVSRLQFVFLQRTNCFFVCNGSPHRS